MLIATVVALAAWPSVEVFAQNKAKKPTTKAPIDSDKLTAHEFIGTLKITPGSDRMFTVEVEQDQLVPTGRGSRNSGRNYNRNNGNGRAPNMNRINSAINRMQQAMQRGQQAQGQLNSAGSSSARNQAQRNLSKAQSDLNRAEMEYQKALAQYLVEANAQANAAIVRAIRSAGTGVPSGFKIVKSITPIEFEAAETVKVRTMVLDEEFDEKGNPKKFTKAELAELKGKDKNLPGYESAIEKLQTGQVLRVTLATPAKKPVKKDDDKDVEPETGKNSKVKLIVVLKEPTTNAEAGKKGKGK
jgi:multidrug efflux pump subunit AcrA (membrane-fusion protein)